MFEGLFQPTHLLLIMLIAFAALIMPYWHIFKKAGFSPWLSLLIVIPFVGFFAIYYLAFARWPEKSN
jgi:hypothetical protein